MKTSQKDLALNIPGYLSESLLFNSRTILKRQKMNFMLKKSRKKLLKCSKKKNNKYLDNSVNN